MWPEGACQETISNFLSVIGWDSPFVGCGGYQLAVVVGSLRSDTVEWSMLLNKGGLRDSYQIIRIV